MRIDVTSVSAPIQAARGLVDTATRVYYTPTNTNHLIVTTENGRLLKFDAPSGKLIAEVSRPTYTVVIISCQSNEKMNCLLLC